MPSMSRYLECTTSNLRNKQDSYFHLTVRKPNSQAGDLFKASELSMAEQSGSQSYHGLSISRWLSPTEDSRFAVFLLLILKPLRVHLTLGILLLPLFCFHYALVVLHQDSFSALNQLLLTPSTLSRFAPQVDNPLYQPWINSLYPKVKCPQ